MLYHWDRKDCTPACNATLPECLSRDYYVRDISVVFCISINDYMCYLPPCFFPSTVKVGYNYWQRASCHLTTGVNQGVKYLPLLVVGVVERCETGKLRGA